ncbi:hypothetical protein ACIQBJ_33170 [Kitasatospora sp. NPDC088391]|uniref:hypothetical protein n=1 Tax=Kitasatospora sp. NPDC088391 TaxID=3364074 RepID=UPI0037FD8143
MNLTVVHAVHQAARAYEARTPTGEHVIVIEALHRSPGQLTRTIVTLPQYAALDLVTDIESVGW